MPGPGKPAPPDWMVESMAAGLQHLLLLGLPGRPPAETITGTAHAWADAFWCLPKAWDKDLDAPRIAAAFRIAASQVECFPAPKSVIAVMPRPPQKALPLPEMSEEKRRANLKRLAELFGSLKHAGPPKRKPKPETCAAALTTEQEEALLEELRQYQAKKAREKKK